MKYTSLFAVLLLVTAATTPALAAPDEPPLADAGLDQTVTRGTTVHLDGGGSRDPDGTITNYAWTIETPNGSTATPDCVDCEQAQFPADTVGEHEVTLTVTGDDGATATDTLYVDVEPGAPPSVSVAGPAALAPGERGTYAASVSAGAAPLDRVVWYVDGEHHSTESVDGTAVSVEQRLQFPDSGGHEVRAVAVDEDDQRGNDTRAVAVSTSSTANPVSSSPGTGTDSDTSAGDSSNSANPDVSGPRVVTGDAVLDATYTLTDDASGDWFLDDHHAGVGNTASLTLSPGRHDLYASPDGGDGGVATFPDGTRTVVADPAPDIRLERVTEESIVTVDAYATDDLANLQSVEVLVDGDVVSTETVGGIERRSAAGDRLTVLERLDDVLPGNRNITVRATDARGQTDSESRTVHVPGPPEVVSAAFANDEPLTSRHPKLDPEDYTGEFRIDVDLNGVDPEQVEAQFREPRNRFVSISPSQARSTATDSVLTIQKNHSRSYGGKIDTTGTVYWERGNERKLIQGVSGTTHADLSKPVIRLDLADAQNRIGSLGATFDASESFDPDGSNLTFQWNDVNSTDKWLGPVKQLHPQKLIYLNVTDEQNQFNRTYEILDWFTPGLQTPEAQNTDPVFPQDAVTYRVRTTEYELSQAVYEKEEQGKLIDFELVSNDGTVGGHTRYTKDENGGHFDQNRPEGFSGTYIFHEWLVTVPASEFLDDDQPMVRIQSTSQSEAFREVDLPDPKMYEQVGASTDLWEFDVQYIEEHPEYEVRKTANADRKDALQEMGFDLYTSHDTGTEYHLEKRVKTQSAQWETVTREFDRKFRRQVFLDANDEWQTDGSRSELRERTVTEREWRDHRGGSGEFTGDTRRVQVEPPEVKTLREYEYEREYTVEVTETEEYESCLPGFGCRTYTVEKTTTETRTREYDYWSSRPRNSLHDWTGATKVRTVESAEYERQYEHRVEETETYWERVYRVSTREKVQDAQYEWQAHATVTSERAAAIMTTSADIRQAGTDRTREWTLRRQAGTFTRTTDTPEQRSSVIETEMTARAHVRARYLPPNPTIRSDTVTRERIVDITETTDQFVPTEEAKNIIREKANETHAEDL